MLTSCASENLDLSNQDVSVVNVRKWFDTSKPKLEVLDYTQTIDWSNANVSNGDKGIIVEVPLILKASISAKVGDDKSFKTYNRLIFFPDEKETYNAYHVLITTNDLSFDNKNKDFNFYKINNNFDGYITIVNDNKEVIEHKKYIGGHIFLRSKTSKIKEEAEICVYFGAFSGNGDFTPYYLVGCYGSTGGIGTGYGSGRGGGAGDATTDEALCDASLADITSQAFAASNFLSSTIISENSSTRNKQYSWNIFNCLGFSLNSYQIGMHKKVANIDPSLQWERVSLTHNNIASTGFVVGVDMSYMDISNLPTVGKYNAIMSELQR